MKVATYSEIVFLEGRLGSRRRPIFRRLEQMCSYLIEDSGEYRRAIVETRPGRYPSDLFDRQPVRERGVRRAPCLRANLGDSPPATGESASSSRGTRFRAVETL